MERSILEVINFSLYNIKNKVCSITNIVLFHFMQVILFEVLFKRKYKLVRREGSRREPNIRSMFLH